ncbi:MAG: DUF423 domain-containing protein [gamma proteobacterium symbiont of Bathyaustriella thionipta]|nr:DUF423 domain-containing protein [gamma proteobacterium symbiont of Bathyaustriella thionipta]
MNARFILSTAAISGFLSVAIGAFGAHALRGQLDEQAAQIFATAHDYQISHTLALLFIGLLLRENASKKLTAAAVFMLAGILLFSGSLYVLAISGIKWVAIITPLGGFCFLLGWLLLLLGILNLHLRYDARIDKQGKS